MFRAHGFLEVEICLELLHPKEVRSQLVLVNWLLIDFVESRSEGKLFLSHILLSKESIAALSVDHQKEPLPHRRLVLTLLDLIDLAILNRLYEQVSTLPTQKAEVFDALWLGHPRLACLLLISHGVSHCRKRLHALPMHHCRV